MTTTAFDDQWADDRDAAIEHLVDTADPSEWAATAVMHVGRHRITWGEYQVAKRRREVFYGGYDEDSDNDSALSQAMREHKLDVPFTVEPAPQTKINLNLRDTYRACDVKRWGIVKTLRPQSVAEHAYQVTIIASRICDLMEVGQATRQEVLWVALTHDLPEVLTGDMATPLKEMIGPDARQRLKEFERNILVTGRKHFSDNETVNKIIKMADLAEAIAFLNINAATQHGEDVKTKLEASLMGIDKHIAGVVMYELTCIQETTLDCIQDGF